MKKIFLVDGSGFLYRAYYAYPVLTDKEGNNQNVVYGFFRMLLKIFAEKPDYFVIAWDAPTKTKRHEAYPEYKANRVKAPDEFKRQIPIVQEIVNKLGIPNVVNNGYEADDIIATLAKDCRGKDLECFIYSSDKDLKQLLTDNVFIKDPMKDILAKTENFINEFGFEPSNMLDYLALIGDASDNIKGVPGIGPKGASDLIKEYKTLDNIYSNIDKISGANQQKLIDGKDAAYHSLDLINLMNVPELNNVNFEEYKLDINFEKYDRILAGEYGFTSISKLLKELKNKIQAPTQMGLF